jgi:hypothetical protein
MAPKETKRDKERRLKEQAQEQEATDAATDGPTDNEPEVPIQYDAEGVIMRPGTSSAAAAASSLAPGGHRQPLLLLRWARCQCHRIRIPTALEGEGEVGYSDQEGVVTHGQVQVEGAEEEGEKVKEGT